MKPAFQINKILVAVENSDYSTKASAYAFGMARQLGAEIAVIHVSDLPVQVPYMADPLLNEPQVFVPEIMQLQEDAGKQLLDKVSDQLGKGLNVFTFNKTGNTEDELLNTADEWKADIIILGTHGRTGIDHFLSGSVAENMVRKAKCAILIVPNT